MFFRGGVWHCAQLSATYRRYDDDGLQGLGIIFITIGLMALAFMSFSGVQL